MSGEEWMRIKENQRIGNNIYSITMESEKISQSIEPGQFIHLLCRGEYGAFLRRPFSLSNIDKDNKEISIVYRVQGKGTKSLSEMKTGEVVNALGPLGNGFLLDAKYDSVAIVGGGMGIAALMEVIKYYKDKSRVYLGFMEETILIQEIKNYSSEIHITTEKGNIGRKGLITDGLLSQWEKSPPQMVYTCGPKAMMREVSKISTKLDLPCQVSMEERMGCGIGACLVCSCKTKAENQEGSYTRVCKDGPVYWGEEIDWDE